MSNENNTPSWDDIIREVPSFKEKYDNKKSSKVYSDIGEELRLVHIFNRNQSTVRGGLTIVYHWDKKDSFITFSTSVCSKQDIFSRKIGAEMAIDNFNSGMSTRLPFDRKKFTSPAKMLRHLFSELYRTEFWEDWK